MDNSQVCYWEVNKNALSTFSNSSLLHQQIFVLDIFVCQPPNNVPLEGNIWWKTDLWPYMTTITAAFLSIKTSSSSVKYELLYIIELVFCLSNYNSWKLFDWNFLPIAYAFQLFPISPLLIAWNASSSLFQTRKYAIKFLWTFLQFSILRASVSD